MAVQEAADLHAARVKALHVVDRAIVGSVEVGITLHVFLDQVVEQLKVDAAGVLLCNAEERSLESVALRGYRRPPPQAFRVQLGEGLPGAVAQSRQPITIEDLQTDSRYLRGSDYVAEDFVAYYGVPLLSKGELRGVLEVFQRNAFSPNKEWRDFLKALACQAAIAIDNAVLYERVQRQNAELMHTYDTTLEGWARVLEMRDWETEGHTRRVARMCIELAREMGIRGDELLATRRGALLHDVGKIGIPDAVLLKAGPLTEQEWDVMRRHPELGYQLLEPIAFLSDALDIPLYHHERWDGRGYPRGLRGEDIPLPARVFAVVDAWDAMRSDRPYRRGLSEEIALDQIRTGAGAQFDPAVVEAFLESKPYLALDAEQLCNLSR